MTDVVLITGASSGIGAALAKRFAAAGHPLILTARRKPELDALAASLAVTCEVIVCDLAAPDGAATLAAELRSRNLTVDVLVNNAGFGQYGEFAGGDPVHLMNMMQVNIVALTQLTRLLLPAMIERKQGRILNVASIAAFMPGPLMAVYYASKAYVLSFSEGLRWELRGSGVTVTCLCPGPTTTEFVARAKLGASKLFDSPGVMTVEPVADAAYRGLMRGKPIVVPGFKNRLVTMAAKWLPRGIMLRIVASIQARRRGGD